MTKKAFTLIELLVVIAIISLLVSVLMPSLAGARDLAKAAVCMTQQKQIGLGLFAYLEDNDQFFPSVNITVGETSERLKWQFALRDYCYIDGNWTGNNFDAAAAGVFHCPGDDHRLERGYAPASYAGNYYADCRWADLTETNYVAKMSTVAEPAVKVYATDSYNRGGGYAHLNTKCPEFLPTSTQAYGIDFRHKDGAQTLFMDLHVETLTIQDTLNNAGLIYPLRY
ncbi:MAG: type II secretion system protein [Planctomycetes bacterium]|mgnify:FL=1|jgi:prepilin-type N-terminal cleavage/methylation domain-containing protein/prepilin-type processing-associated H-X9-DG protein|nr:type II secretion system protein [Planctomycetota bacterium]